MATHANRQARRGATTTMVLVAAALCATGARAETVNRIAAVELAGAASGARVVVHGSQKPAFTVFKLAEPTRVVVDLSASDVTAVQSPVDGMAPGVTGVTTAQFDEGGRKVSRIVVTLEADARYDVSASGNDLVVAIGPVAKADAAPAAPAKVEAAAAKVDAPAKADTPAKAKAPAAEQVADARPADAAPTDPNVVLARTDAKVVAEPAKELEGVTARGQGAVAIVEIATDGEVGNYALTELQNPGRLALDLPGVAMSKKTMKAAGAGPVKGVRVARRDDGVRVVLDGKADRMPKYEISRGEGGLSVRVGQPALAKATQKPAAQTAAAAVKVAAAEAKPAEAKPVENKPVENKPIAVAPQAAPAKPQAEARLVQVKAVDLVTEGGETRVNIVVEGGDPKFELVRNDAGTATVTLHGAALPTRLERNVDATALGGPVTMLSSYRSPGHTDEVKIVASLRDGIKSTAHRSGGRITWSFAGAPAQAQAASVPARAAATASEQRSISMTQQSVLDAGNYTGRRVDFNVKDMDIKNLLGAISEISKRNIILADDVQGRVTIKLRNVPWDQALDIILRSKGLGREEVGNIIRVAPLATLRQEAKDAADASKLERSLEPVKVRLIPVNYAKAENMVGQIKDSLTDRGAISIDTRTNTIIVKDVPDALARAEGIVRTLDTATPEVLIESRIVEATTSFQRQIGIQWGGNVNFAPAFGNPTGLIFPNILQIAGAADDPQAPTSGLQGVSQPNFAVNMPAPIGLNNGAGLGFTMGSAGGAANLNLRLSAAENSGTIKTISSPRVVTLDNVEASVSQGVQIPYSQVSAAGTNTTFVEANLQLRVTPHVTQEGAIQMKISASNNSPNPALTGANGQPSIQRREARTEVLVHDGDTTVIGGIYTRRNSESWNEVPVLSRIPVLGWLFKKKAVTDDRTELLIFITPRIVNRSQSAMAIKGSADDAPPADKQ